MDFSDVKEIKITEGNVKSLSINGVNVWEGIKKLSGTWLFNEKLNIVDVKQDLFFSCSSIDYVKITVSTSDSTILNGVNYYKNGVTPNKVYQTSPNRWTTEKYRTITINEPQTVTPEFYEWFKANATKID